MDELKKFMKRVMPFVQATREKVDQLGVKALALTLEFDEAEVLRNNSPYLANTLDVSHFIISSPCFQRKSFNLFFGSYRLVFISTYY